MQDEDEAADRGRYFEDTYTSYDVLDCFIAFETMLFIFGVMGGRGGNPDSKDFVSEIWFISYTDLMYFSYCCCLIADIFLFRKQ